MLRQQKNWLGTNLSVDLTEQSVVTTDFLRFLKKLKVVETTDKIGCDNRLFGQVNK
jgi:hypothetical protein